MPSSPRWVGTPIQSQRRGGGYPNPVPGGEYPQPAPDGGTLSSPGWGYPQEGTWNQWNYYGMDMGTLLGKDMGPVELLWDGDGDIMKCKGYLIFPVLARLSVHFQIINTNNSKE